jgi:hypothetical protein
MNLVSLPATNGAGSLLANRSNSLAHLSVKQFFSAINWENRAPDLQKLKLADSAQDEGKPLSMMLNVNQFFNAVNWDGVAIAAAPFSAEPPGGKQQDAGNLTLEDFFTAF